MIYRFERRGRTAFTIAVLALVWAAILAFWLLMDMAVWITVFLALFTLPALWDVIRDVRGAVEIWPNRIVWSSTLGRGDRADIDHVRLNRRFDGTMKITLVHVGGATTRLPPDIGAPATDLENALQQAGIPSQRHPFSLI